MVGFQLDAHSPEPALYTVLACNGNDRPITTEHGRIVFFSRPTYVSDALSLGSPAFRELPPPPPDPEVIYDVPEALRLILHEDYDPASVILNLLNTLVDLVRATPCPLPTRHRTVLGELADHLTFHREYGYFISRTDIGREAVHEAVLWCAGVIATNSLVVR